MTSVISATVQSILIDTLHPEAFKKTDSGKHKKKQCSRSSNKKYKSGHKQNVTQQLLPSPVSFNVLNLLPQPQAIKAYTILPTPVLSVPNGFASQKQNVQFVAIPADQMPPFTCFEL